MTGVVDRNPVVRFAEPSDAPGLVRLFAKYYAQYKPEAYFLWQFFSPELSAKLVVAVENDEIVGSFGLMRRPLSHGLRCAQAMDMLLAETHRGRGLFPAMVQYALAAFSDIHYLVVLANRSGMEAVTRSLGWSVIAQVPVFTAPQIPDCGMDGVSESAEARIETEPLRIVYSSSTEHWRFESHPIYRYHGLSVSGVRGYVKVFSNPKDELGSVGDIMYVAPAMQGATEQWLRHAFAWFRENGVKSCGLWALPGTVMATAALRVGLLPRQQERWFCAAPVGDLAERPLDAGWDVCEADAEFY